MGLIPFESNIVVDRSLRWTVRHGTI